MESNTSQIRCEDEPMLQRLLDEELDPDASELVFHHLKECERCSAVFQELRELKSFSEGELGIEDESEARYSIAVLARVRGAIESAAPAQVMQNENGKGLHDDSKNQSTVRETPETSWFQSLRAGFAVLDQSIWLRPGTITAVFVALVLIVGLALWLRTPTIVSAAELLKRSISAEDAIRNLPDQVLRRTINLEERVGQTVSLSNGASTVLHRRIEIWQSADRGLTARRLFDDKDRLLSGEWRKADGSRMIYREGGQTQLQAASERQPGAPLSPEDMWLVDVSAKDFSALIGNANAARVEETNGTYVINYDAQPATNGLVKAMLVLSKADLHTIEQTLLVNPSASNPQVVEFRFTETSFERRNPNAVAPAVFEPDPAVLAATKNKEEGGRMRDAEHPGSSVPVSPLTLAASAELEVDVLEKLNGANALLGEQLSLTRTSAGTLLVSGIVETNERKSEILRSLGNVAKNPAVKIDVATVAEAQQRQKAASAGSITTQNVEVAENAIPVETELRTYLSRRGLAGVQLDQEIEQLSRRVLSHSSRARSHALALKQIAERFSPADLETMDAGARDRWRALIKEHANFFRRELEQMRQELGPIFPGVAAADSGAEIEIAGDLDMARAAKRLFELAAVTDNGLRRSFSLSSARISEAPVKSQEFWRSFSSAESLSTKISRQ